MVTSMIIECDDVNETMTPDEVDLVGALHQFSDMEVMSIL